MELKRIINAILGSLLVAIALNIVVGFAARNTSGLTFWILWIAFGLWFYHQETTKHIWKKTFIFLAIASFLMPIASFIFTVGYVAEETQGVAEGIGATIGGGIATGVLGFLGFFMGIVFLLVGLFAFKVPHDVRVINTDKVKK